MTCKKCGECCKWVGISTSLPKALDLTWINLHGGYVKNGVVFLPLRCTALGDDNECTQYESRPKICRDEPSELTKRMFPDKCRFFEEEK
jgi:Fe-S-cluster containining protein